VKRPTLRGANFFETEPSFLFGTPRRRVIDPLTPTGFCERKWKSGTQLNFGVN